MERSEGAQPYVVRQKAGFELLIVALEAGTGKPVAGAGIWKVPEDRPEERQRIEPSTFIVEDPWIDVKGKMRAVLPPEPGQRYRFRFAGIRAPNGSINPSDMQEYDAEPAESESVELVAGETVLLRFQLRNRADFPHIWAIFQTMSLMHQGFTSYILCCIRTLWTRVHGVLDALSPY
jgi:hypothetical protein